MGNLANIKNVEVLAPQPGDIVALDSQNSLKFYALSNFEKASMPAGTTYVGVVAARNGGEAMILNKGHQLEKFSPIFMWDVTGFILDGAPHDSTVTFNSSAPKPANPTFTYHGFSLQDVADQLNEWLAAYGAQVSKEYYCYPEGEGIRVILSTPGSWYDYSLSMSGLQSEQMSNLFLDGDGNFYAKNGKSGVYMSMHFEKYMSYLHDNTSSTFNPASKAESLTSYPTSYAYFASEKGEYLRGLFGEGEEGYAAFVHSYDIDFPSHRGVLAPEHRDARRNTAKMADEEYRTKDGSIEKMFPAAAYCNGITYPHRLLGRGCWSLPTMNDLMRFVPSLKLDQTDPINRGLEAIGGTKIIWGGHWSSSRYSSCYAWIFNGYHGFSLSSSFWGRSYCRACLLLHLSGSEK